MFEKKKKTVVFFGGVGGARGFSFKPCLCFGAAMTDWQKRRTLDVIEQSKSQVERICIVLQFNVKPQGGATKKAVCIVSFVPFSKR